MRLLTKRLIESFVLDIVPDVAVCINFGIPPSGDPNPQYGALQWGYVNETFSDKELDYAIFNGKRLTELVNRKDSYDRENPYKCCFHTDYFEEEEEL